MFVFLRMAFSYTEKRAQQRYALHKQKAPSVASFRHLSKVLFILSMLMTVSSYWLQYPDYLLLHHSEILQLLGAFLVLFGYLCLNQSFKQLDNNYSPLFDAYKPFKLVKTGFYAYIRHPIYAFNLCVSFGLALSNGVLIVIFSASLGLVFVLRAVFMEEAYLLHEFEEYAAYCNKTWRFIPYVF